MEYASPGFAHAAAGCKMPVDVRKADAFSAGALLYEVLAGQLPCPLPEDAPDSEYSAYFDRRVCDLPRWADCMVMLAVDAIH